ncbi:multiple inositol polyphosphate phosphatase 1-like [Dendronephthya gigantea]|uniref:multiple inositol polyphosphate phosphatase 1-like n=1 Tax=Dendronephthya gigantea TaxID=151771 RepID=UPI00106BE627|nr:multiple inositol polyphosphate phosphatase 1-like [Dendronephthya gigantea]
MALFLGFVLLFFIQLSGEGLFENNTTRSQGPGRSKFRSVAIKSAGPEENDKLLSSYDACPRYVADSDKNGLPEVEKFTQGPEIRNVIRTIEKRLRINGTISLTFEDVDVIRRLCAFGIMNHEDDSWCALLDSASLDVMNYVGDLKNFYEHSFGNELGYEIICVLLADIIENLEDFSKGSSEARGVFRFASSGTMFALLTALGAYDNGTTLSASNFRPNSSRRFPSRLVPMSANIALVLFKCNLRGKQNETQNYKVQILINEKPMALPCCQGNITCSFEEFQAYFKHTVDNCDFDAMCALRKDKSTTTKALGLVNRPGLFLVMMEMFFATFKMLNI